MFGVSKDLKKNPKTMSTSYGQEIREQEGGVPHLKLQVCSNPCFRRREVAIRKVRQHILSLTLIVKELKISAEQSRVVTTLNIIKH